VLGLSETAVKTRLSRARLRLREELSTYYGKRVTALQDSQHNLASETSIKSGEMIYLHSKGVDENE
jgi:hypothetical protein